MSGYDADAVSSVNMGMRRNDEEEGGVGMAERGVAEKEKTVTEAKFMQFIRTHRDNNGVFIYRDHLKANYEQGDHLLVIDMDDLRAFDESLRDSLCRNPREIINLFESAVQKVLLSLVAGLSKDLAGIPHIQIQLKNFARFTSIRKLSASHVSRLVCLRGIVVSAGRSRIKATQLTLWCRNCKAAKKIPCSAGFGIVKLPRKCDTAYTPDVGHARCPIDPYIIIADSSLYVDQQRLKLQENPEEVPTGEMPRSLTLACDRYLVDSVKPGTRICVIGIYTTYEAKQANKREQAGITETGVRVPYLHVLGIEQENEASEFLLGKFAPEDIIEMQRISRMPGLYEQIHKSIAPAILGSIDIKKAIACQLFGGARKHLPDGMNLRGDINVLLLGDPSVAKSQFLKFAVQVAPIGVYTSGKGSSAAGLTASVIRDPGSGEFQLEGGALVLADGGLVCIDEFDKMKEQDRVAIHEAMEQQTISIAKAGITTILNSRTSVLAAANPVFGRYDDMKSPSDNIEFQSTILSRFDLIFIVKDVSDVKRDEALALHIINVHKNRDQALAMAGEFAIDPEKLKKYIAFCRSKCRPRLSASAAELLKNRYVSFRTTMRDQRKQNHSAKAIPITVRQLEAIVRISESLARMELSETANELHVKEALRLFMVSTFSAATHSYGDGAGSPEFMANVQKAERFIKKRVPIGNVVSTQKLIKEMSSGQFNFGPNAVNKAIDLMVQRETMRYTRQRKLVERIRA